MYESTIKSHEKNVNMGKPFAQSPRPQTTSLGMSFFHVFLQLKENSVLYPRIQASAVGALA